MSLKQQSGMQWRQLQVKLSHWIHPIKKKSKKLKRRLFPQLLIWSININRGEATRYIDSHSQKKIKENLLLKPNFWHIHPRSLHLITWKVKKQNKTKPLKNSAMHYISHIMDPKNKILINSHPNFKYYYWFLHIVV